MSNEEIKELILNASDRRSLYKAKSILQEKISSLYVSREANKGLLEDSQILGEINILKDLKDTARLRITDLSNKAYRFMSVAKEMLPKEQIEAIQRKMYE